MESIDQANAAILFASALVMLGILSSLIATRIGAPLLLVFLGLGMLAGEDGIGGVHFSDFRTTYTVGSVALAIILFDGGLRTRFADFRGTLWPALVLATLGVCVTAIICGAIAWAVLPLGPLESLLLGTVVASTDAAAVMFLLRAGGLRLGRRVGATLEIESGTNDPMAVVVTLVLVRILIADQVSAAELAIELGREGGIGALAGVAAGLGLSLLLNRMEMPQGLHPLLVATGGVAAYAIAAVLGGSGFLAVYLAGLVLGNRRMRARASVLSFHEALTWLSQIVMFVLLGLLVTPHELWPRVPAALAVALGLILLARPAAVLLCIWPFRFGRRERIFVSWVGLRGAVAIFLASIPVLAGLPAGRLYFDVAFVVVIVSLALQGWTVAPAARRLGVALPPAAPRTTRVDLDLPGQIEQDLVGFRTSARAPIATGHSLPPWARVAFLVRDERVLSREEAGEVRPGDYVYVLAPSAHVPRLDRLFAPARAEPARPEPPAEVDGELKVGELVDSYELDAAPEDRELALADYVAGRLDGPPAIGDRVVVADLEFVVSEVEEGRIARLAVGREANRGDAPRSAVPVPVSVPVPVPGEGT